MGSKISSEEFQPQPIDISVFPDLAGACAERLECRVIDRPGPWLEAAYALLSAEFEPDVLDPYDRYQENLSPGQRDDPSCQMLMLAAFIPEGNAAHIAGVIAGDLMQVKDPASAPGSAGEKRVYFFAIGNQVTSPELRQRGIKGVGGRLLGAASETACSRVERLGGMLRYTALESEADSTGFWDHMGYRWPRGVRYWQPPLEFKPDGHYVNPEVPEILMLKPHGGAAPDTIDRDLLKNIVATIYENWSLGDYRAELAPEAMARAEQYVMGTVFGRIVASMPAKGPIPLVRVPEGMTAEF